MQNVHLNTQPKKSDEFTRLQRKLSMAMSRLRFIRYLLTPETCLNVIDDKYIYILIITGLYFTRDWEVYINMYMRTKYIYQGDYSSIHNFPDITRYNIHQKYFDNPLYCDYRSLILFY